MKTVTLETIHNDLEIIKKEVSEIKDDINELRNIELEVKPEYLEKLKEIREGKGIPFKNIDDLRKIIEK